jgi:hypothetical protein
LIEGQPPFQRNDEAIKGDFHVILKIAHSIHHLNFPPLDWPPEEMLPRLSPGNQCNKMAQVLDIEATRPTFKLPQKRKVAAFQSRTNTIVAQFSLNWAVTSDACSAFSGERSKFNDRIVFGDACVFCGGKKYIE